MHSAELPDMVEAALGKAADECRALRPNVWQCRLPIARGHVHAELADDWLRLSVRPRIDGRPTDAACVRRMLRRNATMRGRPRIVWSESRHLIVSDMPADLLAEEDGEDLEAIISSALGELAGALSRRNRTDACFDDSDEHVQVSHEALVQALSEAGWSPRGDENDLEVPLALSGEFLSARILRDARGVTVSAALPAHDLDAAPGPCRDAVSVLLLLTASRFRLVKPTLNQATPALEVFVAQPQMGAASLGHACAALHAAAQAIIAEAQMLSSDDRLAHIYLTNVSLERAA